MFCVVIFLDAELVGKGVIVMNASGTQVAFTGLVNSRGNAIVRKAGGAFSVTRVSSSLLIVKTTV